ncbi:MAG: hypothetical protein J6D54_04065 [Olsenella sp.]|nr:hypothetical protein [Olsenella sp.]
MANSFMEQHVENAVQNAIQDAMGEKAVQFIQGINKFASKQGGKTEIENYKLLGKRVLIVAGIGIATVQVVSWVGGTLISRKLEAQRVEKIVRRILEEERQKEIDAKTEASAVAGAEAVTDDGTDDKADGNADGNADDKADGETKND